MCGGVEARDAERSYKVYFPSPKAAIPVMLEGGESLGWVKWGRRREEAGQGPQGGWARLETVERGGWAKYQPIKAYGLVQRFMEKDAERKSHWFDVEPGFALDCLVLGEGEQRRVYVITSSPPEEFAWIHDRWPAMHRYELIQAQLRS
ncbi:hypothetical protein [Stutzerimonas degradans]|uniref:hypothetical protein n=1 Tax=Stutzerimonas degradans TaxID=2968968 RepID=UPI001C497E29|nr:hypothetical protein [Stutzerimonas degradans]